MRKRRAAKLLTEVELEFMTALWALGRGSVRDILDGLPEGRALAYTTGATIMRILDDKGFVKADKVGKVLVYEPLLAKNEYQTRSIENLSKTLFDDTPANLVVRLVDDGGLSDEDLAEIRAMLDKRLGDDDR